jgi:hypothetical protein
MSRERLTSRTAEDLKAKPGAQVEAKGAGIDNDPYNQNDTNHEKNDPKIDQYGKGDPSAWGEDVNKDNPAKDDSKREENGYAPLIDKHAAAEAIASAKRLEEKAVKCIIAAQRILPGAAEEMIEKQAAIFMHLPEEGLNATLTNQESLAKQIAKQASKVAGEAECEHEEKETPAEEAKEEKALEEAKEEKDAAAEELDDKKKKLEELKKQASALETEITAGQNADANKNNPQGKKTEKKAGEEEDKKEEKVEEKKEEKDAASEEKVEEKKEEETKEEEKEIEASDGNLLDQIFGEVTASETKKGASTLAGMVKKQASDQVTDLSGLWASSPDVSNLF